MPGTSVQISRRRACSLAAKVAAGRVRTTAAEQDRLALRVAGDEALREQHAAARRKSTLKFGVWLEIAGRGQVPGALRRTDAFLGMQDGAGIDPLHVEPLGREEIGADAGRHQFPGCHDPGAQAIADLADQVDAGCHPAQLDEIAFEFRADRDPEVTRQVGVPKLDLVHHRLPVAGQRPGEKLLEAIGDAGERRVNDHGPQALRRAWRERRRPRSSSCLRSRRWCRRTSGRPSGNLHC